MAKGQKRSSKKVVKKKKKWYKVIAPAEFRNVELGETPALEPKNLKGRVFKVNLMTLLRDMKKQNYAVYFKSTDNTQSELKTESVKFEINPLFIKRLVRKGRERIDDSFIVETKDEVKVRVKTLYVTRKKTQKNVLSAIRLTSRELIAKFAKENNYNTLFMAVVQGSLQRQLKKDLKKIYPLTTSEIRVLQKITKK